MGADVAGVEGLGAKEMGVEVLSVEEMGVDDCCVKEASPSGHVVTEQEYELGQSQYFAFSLNIKSSLHSNSCVTTPLPHDTYCLHSDPGRVVKPVKSSGQGLGQSASDTTLPSITSIAAFSSASLSGHVTEEQSYELGQSQYFAFSLNIVSPKHTKSWTTKPLPHDT